MSNSVARKRVSLPIHFSSHTVHTLNKHSTSKRKYHFDYDDVGVLVDILRKILELDKVIYTSGKNYLQAGFLLQTRKNFKEKSLLNQGFLFSGTLKLSSRLTLQMLSINTLLRTSTQTHASKEFQMKTKVLFSLMISVVHLATLIFIMYFKTAPLTLMRPILTSRMDYRRNTLVLLQHSSGTSSIA